MRTLALLAVFATSLALVFTRCQTTGYAVDNKPTPTRRFEVRNDRPFLGGKQIDLWGLRCGNAL